MFRNISVAHRGIFERNCYCSHFSRRRRYKKKLQNNFPKQSLSHARLLITMLLPPPPPPPPPQRQKINTIPYPHTHTSGHAVQTEIFGLRPTRARNNFSSPRALLADKHDLSYLAHKHSRQTDGEIRPKKGGKLKRRRRRGRARQLVPRAAGVNNERTADGMRFVNYFNDRVHEVRARDIDREEAEVSFLIAAVLT